MKRINLLFSVLLLLIILASCNNDSPTIPQSDNQNSHSPHHNGVLGSMTGLGSDKNVYDSVDVTYSDLPMDSSTVAPSNPALVNYLILNIQALVKVQPNGSQKYWTEIRDIGREEIDPTPGTISGTGGSIDLPIQHTEGSNTVTPLAWVITRTASWQSEVSGWHAWLHIVNSSNHSVMSTGIFYNPLSSGYSTSQIVLSWPSIFPYMSPGEEVSYDVSHTHY